jgi:hypothetical protein
MLSSTKDLENYTIRAIDGDIGRVSSFYFDDQSWVIRYLAVNSGGWLADKQVLISPIAISSPNWEQRVLPVAITREQVKNSPDIDPEMPIPREHEIRYLGYYGYPAYWGGTGLWGADAHPGSLMRGAVASVPMPIRPPAKPDAMTNARDNEGPHLHSCTALQKYRIAATDGDIGHVEGFLVDEDTWAIRYLIVGTSNWWLGHQVLIAPQWIEQVRQPNATVSVRLTRKQVRNAPPYDPSARPERGQESGLHAHDAQSGYWTGKIDNEITNAHSRA